MDTFVDLEFSSSCLGMRKSDEAFFSNLAMQLLVLLQARFFIAIRDPLLILVPSHILPPEPNN